MKRKFHKPEQIVRKLREADAAIASGSTVDEVLDREVFYSVKEAKVVAESWRLEYNNHRLHSGLGYMTPAAFAASCIPSASPTAQPQEYRTRNMDNSLIRVGT